MQFVLILYVLVAQAIVTTARFLGGRGAVLVLGGVLTVVAWRRDGQALSAAIRDLWSAVALPLAGLGGALSLAAMAAMAWGARNRRVREVERFQLVLSEADAPTFGEVAAACEQLVHTLRRPLTSRVAKGQPWMAIESWFVPAGRVDHKPTAALVLLCDPATRDRALGALRRAYPNLRVRPDPASGGTRPLRLPEGTFVPSHVLRTRKTSAWALPVDSAGRGPDPAERQTMAEVMRRQMQAQRLSCARWSVLPAAHWGDDHIVHELKRLAGRRRTASHPHKTGSSATGGIDAKAYLELQVAVERRGRHDGRERAGPASFLGRHRICQELLTPALTHRGVKRLASRAMALRQGLYRRRWARSEPPLWSDPRRSTLMSPLELALLMELPTLRLGPDLPLARDKAPRPTPSAQAAPGGPAAERPSPAARRATDAQPARRPAAGDSEDDDFGEREVGGVRAIRVPPPPPLPDISAESPVLAHACRPTQRSRPEGPPAPATEAAHHARRAAAAYEAIRGLSERTEAGDEHRAVAHAEAQTAHEQALIELTGEENARRRADQRARRASKRVLEPHRDAPWCRPIGDVRLRGEDVHALEVIARLRWVAPGVVGRLVAPTLSDRRFRDCLDRLYEPGLIARTSIERDGRPGRRPSLYEITERGRHYLREHHEPEADDEPPRHLQPRTPLKPGLGREVPHELATQVALVALRQFAGHDDAEWETPRMADGQWHLGMTRADPRDRELTLDNLLPGPGYKLWGETPRADTTLKPDVSVRLRGEVDGRRTAVDLFLEVDQTARGAYNRDKFIAYDHFLGGWCQRLRRFRGRRPLVVFIASDASRIDTLMNTADRAMTVGYGKPAQYDHATFDYVGRAHTAFTCMEWLLGGQALAYRLPPLPPQERTSASPGRELVALLPEPWWPTLEREAAGGNAR